MGRCSHPSQLLRSKRSKNKNNNKEYHNPKTHNTTTKINHSTRKTASVNPRQPTKPITTMGIEHLLYTPQQDPTNHHPTTMVMLVDGDAYNKRESSGTTAANIVDSFDVFKYASGKQGELLRPNKTEITNVFGTTNVDEIANFMLQNGHLHGGHGKKKADHEEEEADPHSRMHVHRSGRPL